MKGTGGGGKSGQCRAFGQRLSDWSAGDVLSGFVCACPASLSYREAARVFGIDRKTVEKMLAHFVPPGYRRSRPVSRPKLDPFTGIIARILEADRQVHRKQRHTAKRMFERLRDEHGFTGGYTIVKAREARERSSGAGMPAARRGGFPSYAARPSCYPSPWWLLSSGPVDLGKTSLTRSAAIPKKRKIFLITHFPQPI